MSSIYNYCIFLFFGCMLFTACSQEISEQKSKPTAPENNGQTYFRLLEAGSTGVDFINQVEDQEDFNILTYRNFYNGGGVAIGDINNDSLPDLYFTANLTGNKLYLNKGNMTFEDVTEQAGVAGTKAWSTGVTMADVNGDGWLDIYVSNSGDIAGDNKENELFINHGDLSFSEQAEEYGLNNQGYSTQAAFFDYDLDGDLDCYLLNNSFKDPSKIDLFKSMRDEPDEMGGDKLYRNDGNKFTDITLQANIYSSAIGFGLGAVIGDINQDMYPDIYISNDFWERDYLYINQGDGSFSEELIDRIDFCSISSMGGDMADINNDGHPEIFTTDMLAGDNYRLKAMSAFDPYHLENMKYRANYHYQIGQNCLHLNDGKGDFQEIGMLSDVAATDWSWGALIFDFENDGHKDLFVSNGLQRDLMYMDFRDFLSDNGVYRKIAQKEKVDYSNMITQMPSNPIRNFAFSNTGRLGFEDNTVQLGLAQPSFSNGAAYGDLDNDGDQDLVINNVNMPVFIYQNEAEKTQHHYLKIKFKGYANNPFGIGAQVKISIKENIQVLQNFNTRGFESSIEPYLLFGLGEESSIDQLEVIWPDKRKQLLKNIAADQTLTLDHEEASSTAVPVSTARNVPAPLLTEVSDQLVQGDSRHQENRYNDFDHEILLWRMLSTEGPRIVKGDVNGDKLEDFVLLGAKDDEDKLFTQRNDGSFKRTPSEGLKIAGSFESSCGAFLDVDQDGDQDLMLGAGGNEYLEGGQHFILRYFENDGQGKLKPSNRNVPRLVGNFSCLEAADFNGDGSMDMFLGGRCVPGNYGLPPRSYLMVNKGGNWVDETPEALSGIGMVTDASWVDIDGDQDKDLIVVGEWMGIHIFNNEDGKLVNSTEIKNSQGWWNRIEAADLDKDGDMDFVLGNWGLNSKLQASPEKPLSLYVNDFDRNNKSEFILSWYAPLDDQAYPFAPKGELTKQLPQLRKQILKYEDYARQTYETLFPLQLRQQSLTYKASYLESAILWNEGGNFSLTALPVEAQVAPVFAIAVEDFNEDGYPDIWLGGNFYALKPQVGRHDASRGTLLLGRGSGKFEALSPAASGTYVEGEVRDAVMIESKQSKVMLVSRNNENIVVFQKK
ncbi:hypothetical protein OKW21_006401 [Catalinimonas alkaloidigena]|uniref:VCBS repeat-containing protein n=1 Tax=Catalinimonas alkaloidigena TaxID=1075417 RepID=UPI00240665B9|nr:VCBS repeat-containing protein [Catalinimonas alkaloidigena]MDF9801138.1 hypothetical protein [Catalinimonas alkaloidigena]